MAVADLAYGTLVSNTGWTDPLNGGVSDDVYATCTAASSVYVVEQTDVPGDFGSINSVTLSTEWSFAATASRSKSLLLELVDTAGTVLHSYQTPAFTNLTADTVHSSGAIASALDAAALNAARLRVTMIEGGGKADSVTVRVDRAWVALDYNAAATIPEGTASVTGVGTVTASGGIAPETKTGTATVTGAGSAAATGAKMAQGTASSSGTGAAIATGTKRGAGSATATGTGTVTATGAAVGATPTGTATVTGAGTTTATGAKRASGTASVSGAGAVAATGAAVSETPSGSASVSGAGSVAAIGAKRATGAATVSGAGSVTATGEAPSTPGGAGGITGTGSVAAVGSKISGGSLALVAIATVTATGLNIENVVQVRIIGLIARRAPSPVLVAVRGGTIQLQGRTNG